MTPRTAPAGSVLKETYARLVICTGIRTSPLDDALSRRPLARLPASAAVVTRGMAQRPKPPVRCNPMNSPPRGVQLRPPLTGCPIQRVGRYHHPRDSGPRRTSHRPARQQRRAPGDPDLPICPSRLKPVSRVRHGALAPGDITSSQLRIADRHASHEARTARGAGLPTPPSDWSGKSAASCEIPTAAPRRSTSQYLPRRGITVGVSPHRSPGSARHTAGAVRLM